MSWGEGTEEATPASVLVWARTNLRIIDWFRDDTETFKRKYGELQLATRRLTTPALQILFDTLSHAETIFPDTPFLSDIARRRFDAYRWFVIALLDERH